MAQSKAVRTASHEKAEDGTVYWTLSFYIEPEKVAEAFGQTSRLTPDVFRKVQSKHLPSRALRDAINPLFNDIADREMQGDVHDFLLAADDEPKEKAGTPGAADEVARGYLDLTFVPPEKLSWRTEGRKFTACPKDLSQPRAVRLRRFWMAHNNGALSYHLSFTHHYGMKPDWESHSPATYYFLSCLQKLAAPKEYGLSAKASDNREVEREASIFDDDLGIDPVDHMWVLSGASDTEGCRFWAFVSKQFDEDAGRLFPRIAEKADLTCEISSAWRSRLLDEVRFTEVPGLTLPKSRFMFFFRDSRFFDRLMPVDPATQELVPRRTMVRSGCYAPYRDEVRPCDGDPAECRSLSLDDEFWNWVETRPDWSERLAKGQLQVKGEGGSKKILLAEQEALDAIRSGTAYLNETGAEELDDRYRLHIPAFEWRRGDCLDYMFLAGFNQNIIDFMNQDASEILDSTDPLYPSGEDQANERFFVRYANHRGMITYVQSSRSLEFGNDYIGTCPYAFLIHVLALHNEFLGRAHEARSLAAIDEINRLIDKGFYHLAEKKINQVKLDGFNQFERYRFENPFRYDTEQAVFAGLEERRGISRKKAAIDAAVHSLEDHAADLQNEVTKHSDARRDILLGGLGIYGAGQMIYWIGEKANSDQFDPVPRKILFLPWGDTRLGDVIMSLTEVVIYGFTVGIAVYLGRMMVLKWRAQRALADYENRRQK